MQPGTPLVLASLDTDKIHIILSISLPQGALFSNADFPIADNSKGR
jgi:hypothetical protein